MADVEERKDIRKLVRERGSGLPAAIEALRIVNERQGWISDQGVSEIARLIGLPPGELDGVATFYDRLFRRPVGTHLISACDGISCWITGSGGLLSHLSAQLGINPGETTADGAFTLLPVACLGACDQAPAMLIDGRLYGNLSPEKADLILDEISGAGGHARR